MHNELIRPGHFQRLVAADSRRMAFDYYNDAVLVLGIKPNFVFIGDSITEFWDLPLFFGRDKVLLNRGIGGDVPEFILKRFEADVLQLKPEYCVMMAGTNCANQMMDNIWIGTKGESFEKVTGKVIADLTAVVDLCISAGQKLILGAITPAIVPPGDHRNEMILNVNERMEAYCREHRSNGIYFVDYHTPMYDVETKMMRADCTTDGIHPDARGFRVMTNVLRETLRGYGIEI